MSQEEKEILKRIGSKIRTIRKSKKITQQELADYLKISRTYLSELENGKYNFTFLLFLKIGEYLKIDLAMIYKK